MGVWKSSLHHFGALFGHTLAQNEVWRLLAVAALLVFGFALLEMLWRAANRRVHASLEKRGFAPDIWKLKDMLPPLRLAGASLLLRMGEAMLLLPDELRRLVHGVEALVLALAVIGLMFYLVDFLDRLHLALPSRVREEISGSTLAALKSLLRIAVLVGVMGVFVQTQKSLLPPWLLQHSFWRFALLAVMTVAIFLGARLIDRFLLATVGALRQEAGKTRLLLVLNAAVWPVRLLFAGMILYAAGNLLPLPPAGEKLAATLLGLVTTLAVVVFLYRLLDVLVHELSKIAQREENLLDEAVVHLVRIVARVVVIVVGGIYLVQALSGKPMSTLLAGLGIGGLAVALAAQDTLKNFFGSLMIMLDKPFSVGNRVMVAGYDGVVEEIGLRSTRVRTLTGHLVTIPNEKMASSGVENVGRRPHIRRMTNLALTYDTPPEKVERAVAIIKQILDNHEGMHPDFPPRVYFTEFNEASLNIVVFYWYHPAVYWDFAAFSEKVNLRIMRAFQQEGIEFAFPTTTTYLAHDDRRPLRIGVRDLADPPVR